MQRFEILIGCDHSCCPDFWECDQPQQAVVEMDRQPFSPDIDRMNDDVRFKIAVCARYGVARWLGSSVGIPVQPYSDEGKVMFGYVDLNELAGEKE
ncbi:MAG: hypothetical protein ACD_51C00360G0003 [uncultured bacterium]|nr:MAG: hypothetical protein ACD_51C00360G0003 [uncultured bacterium]OGJ53372.1 MAG: hypothetical protein A2448_01975 [Candidatus Peregrinibacteria bacterium RIFOXYC2_FULL_41_22]